MHLHSTQLSGCSEGITMCEKIKSREQRETKTMHKEEDETIVLSYDYVDVRNVVVITGSMIVKQISSSESNEVKKDDHLIVIVRCLPPAAIL